MSSHDAPQSLVANSGAPIVEFNLSILFPSVSIEIIIVFITVIIIFIGISFGVLGAIT